MERIVKKGMAALVGIALVSAAGLASAETRFAVQDATGTSDKMVVTDQGRIGTNITLPDAALHIRGQVYPDSAMKVEGADSGGFIGLVSVTPTRMPAANQRLGYQYFGGINSTVSPTVSYHATGYYGAAEAQWTTTSTPSFMAFQTTPVNQTTRFERMRINSAGNVGIGTNNPTQRLEVNGGVRLNTVTAKGACSPSLRGVIWMTQGALNVADTLEVCAKDGANNYSWVRLY